MPYIATALHLILFKAWINQGMIMAVLPKKFLRIYDVADYLKSVNPNYEYNLFDSFDRRRLTDDIYDLIIHNQLVAVFKNFTKDFRSAYFVAHDWQVKQILEREDIISVIGNHQIYCYEDGKRVTDIESELLEESSINFDDIYIPRAELDKLFQNDTQSDNCQNINELNQRIKQLEQQLEQSSQQSNHTSTPEYTTDAIEALNAVVDKYWLDYDPEQKNATKQHTIKQFVKDNYPMISDSMALWIDKIARHPSAK